ncbi:MAG: glycoside hydrolase family 97 N-terminal domain-containing protein, partial [Bacteroidales bacterium]|nr:glycoside hydrolase family 97 N-terminal domain-containing protein [Bacteroidales bacterium]
MDKFILILSLLFVCNWQVKAENFQLKSPNGTIQVTINWEGGQLKYKVESNGEELIAPSLIGMNTNAFGIKDLADVKKVTNSNGHEDYTPVWGTTQRVSESFNTTTIEFEKDFSIEFRAYDCGIAWRFISKSGKEIVVVNEVSEFNLNKGNTVFFPETDDFSTPFEPNYIPINIEKVAEQKLGLTPVLIKSPKGQAMVITDVNVKNYPGMFVHMSRSGLNATFPAYPSKEKEQFLGRLRLTNIPQLSKMLVVETEGYIAKTKGTNQFPWRAILIETTEKELLTNSLVEALADKPVSDNDFTWVKPGKVVWDWYHNWKFDDVNFKPGINTETYRYMIDFAVENNIEYVNIDDGWSGLHNFNKINKKLDLDEVLAYAKQKEIGIFLWCTWQTLEENLQENLDYFQQLGVAGLKVDFFDRCDQKVVDFVNQLGEECAQRKLLL